MNTGQYLAEFIESHDDLLSEIVGVVIEHMTYGRGEIMAISPRENYIPLVRIKFDKEPEPKTFNTESFRSGRITDIQLTPALSETFQAWKRSYEKELRDREDEARRRELAEIQQQRALTEGRAALRALCSKYHVPLSRVIDAQGPTYLAPILLKIDENGLLDDEELRSLEENGLNSLIGTYYYRKYRTAEVLWDLAKASSHFRRASLPERALEITNELDLLPPQDKLALSALWTTRGGAFRDMNRLGKAKECARRAISIAPESHHPHNLMGAIYYEEGDMQAGDEHFEHALELGSPRPSQDHEIRGALKRAEPANQSKIAEYLLSKDSQRFGWARTFVKRAFR